MTEQNFFSTALYNTIRVPKYFKIKNSTQLQQVIKYIEDKNFKKRLKVNMCVLVIQTDKTEQITYLCQPLALWVRLFESLCFCSLLWNKPDDWCFFFFLSYHNHFNFNGNFKLGHKAPHQAKHRNVYIGYFQSYLYTVLFPVSSVSSTKEKKKSAKPTFFSLIVNYPAAYLKVINVPFKQSLLSGQFRNLKILTTTWVWNKIKTQTYNSVTKQEVLHKQRLSICYEP